MNHRPTFPTARELRECDIARFVVSEDELDELLEYVQRSSLPPEAAVTARSFGPMAPPPVPSEQVDLDAIVDRLSSAPSPAGTIHLRRPTDPHATPRPVDLEDVLGYLALEARPVLRAPRVAPTSSPRLLRSWQVAALATFAFTLGSVLTLGLAG